MRILLTGASGFIGRHLLQRLLADGHEVVAAVRTPLPVQAPRLTEIHADFAKDSDKSTWLARLHGIDVVINTVGIFRESGEQTFAKLHVDTPCALFAACAEAGHVMLVVQLSALGADEGAANAYQRSKKQADDFLASLPLRAAIIQPSLVYGRDGASSRLFRALASMPFCLRFGQAPQLVQPIHIDDACAAIAALPGTADSGRIALAGPRALPFTAYLDTLRRAMGMGRLRLLPLPAFAGRWLARLARLLPGSLIDEAAWDMLQRGNAADPAGTARLLGRPPRPPERFIDDPAAERTRARLDWLLPLLRSSVAAVWLITAAVSFGLYPPEDSYRLLERSGVPSAMAPLMLYGAATLDLLIGLGILLLRKRGWLWLLQLGLIGFYTVYIALRLPEFLLHPYGPLSKNLPMLAAIWLLYEFDKEAH
jgi:uncharacterized protein YbjT (DUF2867 family)